MNILKPIKLLPARERVASVLRKAILSRELAQGEIITLDSISKQLDISVTPVREAFQILSREGLIKLKPNKGAEVMGANLKFIEDHYETRAILESEAAAMVCTKKADISSIESIHNKASEELSKGNINSYSNFNQSFHMAIWQAAGNEKIISILSEMWNGLSIGDQETEEEYAKISMAEHQLILEALRKGDIENTRELMKNHIIRSKESILTRFNND